MSEKEEIIKAINKLELIDRNIGISGKDAIYLIGEELVYIGTANEFYDKEELLRSYRVGECNKWDIEMEYNDKLERKDEEKDIILFSRVYDGIDQIIGTECKDEGEASWEEMIENIICLKNRIKEGDVEEEEELLIREGGLRLNEEEWENYGMRYPWEEYEEDEYGDYGEIMEEDYVEHRGGNKINYGFTLLFIKIEEQKEIKAYEGEMKMDEFITIMKMIAGVYGLKEEEKNNIIKKGGLIKEFVEMEELKEIKGMKIERIY